jgi:hypothetical protein
MPCPWPASILKGHFARSYVQAQAAQKLQSATLAANHAFGVAKANACLVKASAIGQKRKGAIEKMKLYFKLSI